MPNYIFLCQGDFLLPPFGRPLPGVILDSVVQWAAPIVMHMFICSFIHSFLQDLLWYHLVQPQHHSPRLMQVPPPSLLASALAPHVLLSTQQPE